MTVGEDSTIIVKDCIIRHVYCVVAWKEARFIASLTRVMTKGGVRAWYNADKKTVNLSDLCTCACHPFALHLRARPPARPQPDSPTASFVHLHVRLSTLTPDSPLARPLSNLPHPIARRSFAIDRSSDRHPLNFSRHSESTQWCPSAISVEHYIRFTLQTHFDKMIR